MTKKLRLLARADDAGVCVSEDEAIRETVTRGIARNVGVMVPAPAFEHAAGMFKSIAGLCLGLHATINAEWESLRWGPVGGSAKAPSLVDEHGHFIRDTVKLHERGVKTGEILDEIQAQLDLARKRGLNIQYIDTHMGFGWLAGVHDGLLRMAEREGLVFDSAQKCSRLPAVEGSFASPGERLIAQLKAADTGTYIIVTHPGKDTEEMRRLTLPGRAPGAVARERDLDRQLFTDPKVLEYCRTHQIELIRYTEI